MRMNSDGCAAAFQNDRFGAEKDLHPAKARSEGGVRATLSGSDAGRLR
jgi:hypothetical protein